MARRREGEGRRGKGEDGKMVQRKGDVKKKWGMKRTPCATRLTGHAKGGKKDI